MIFIINFKQLDMKFLNNKKYSLYLNEVRKYLPAKIDRSPLIEEPLNKSYGVSASPEACRCKAQSEGNGSSPWRGLHQSRRFRRRSRCMLQISPSGASSAIQTQRRLKAPTFGTTSCQAPACLRSRALIPNCAGSQ